MFRFPDPTPILPELETFGIVKRPTTGALAFSSVDGSETQILTHAYPIWEFELTYDALRTRTYNITPDQQWRLLVDYERLLAVYLACRGQYGRFYYRDRSDFSRIGQALGVGDGVTTRFRFIRTFSYGDLIQWEPVGGVYITAETETTIESPQIYVNNVLTTDWSLDTDFQTLVFDTAPANDLSVVADFYYYYYCRFTEDVPDFEEFMHNLHRMQKLKFRSTKDCDETTPNGYPFA